MGAMKQIATKLASGKRLSPDERKFYHVFCVKPKETNQLNLFTADHQLKSLTISSGRRVLLGSTATVTNSSPEAHFKIGHWISLDLPFKFNLLHRMSPERCWSKPHYLHHYHPE
jgi:hypothetical protein